MSKAKTTAIMNAPFKAIVLATKYPTPDHEGFYWAKWRIATDATLEGDELTPSDKWEIVEVNVNGPDETDPEHLSVSVTGVREVQWLENFFWGPGPLLPPTGAP